MHKLLHAIYNALRNMMQSSSSNNPSSDSFERPAENAALPPSAALMLASANSVKLPQLWPPPPPSPSTRPASSTPALFEAHLLRYEGCADHFYEDASAFNAYSGFAAVADGMTVSSRSDLFADSLVRHFVQGEFYLEKPEEQKLWWRLCEREWRVQAIRLFSEMTAEEQDQHTSGSGATFIGFWIDPKHGACLYSIGDCCGLWFNPDRYVETVPEAIQFNNSPNGVDTRQEFNAEALLVSRYKAVEDLPGDMLVLCSDALAEYFLSRRPWEHQPNFWRSMEAMDDQEFGGWANGRRAASELKDDDYTLLMLRFPQSTASRGVAGESAAVHPVIAPALADQKSEQPELLGLPAAEPNEVERKVEDDARLLDDGHRNVVEHSFADITKAKSHLRWKPD